MPGSSKAKRAPQRNTTADRAIDVLLLFDESTPVLRATAISERLGISRSTTYRYLQSLRSYGFVEEDRSRTGFRLGPRVFELARLARKGLGLLPEIALPIMRDLAETTGEAVLLTRRMGDRAVCIERIDSRHPVRLSYERGHLLPIHAGASAKISLAFEPDPEIEDVLRGARLERLTDKTTTSVTKLRRELKEIREAGYCTTIGDIDPDVCGVAAPVVYPDGSIAAGLSIAGPAFRLRGEALDAGIAAVRSAAEALSERLSLTST